MVKRKHSKSKNYSTRSLKEAEKIFESNYPEIASRYYKYLFRSPPKYTARKLSDTMIRLTSKKDGKKKSKRKSKRKSMKKK